MEKDKEKATDKKRRERKRFEKEEEIPILDKACKYLRYTLAAQGTIPKRYSRGITMLLFHSKSL